MRDPKARQHKPAPRSSLPGVAAESATDKPKEDNGRKDTTYCVAVVAPGTKPGADGPKA